MSNLRVAAGTALLCVASGCAASSPSAPTPLSAASAELIVPGVLAPSLALIDSDARPVPLLNEAAGQWLRRNVRGVVLDSTMGPDIRATCCGSDRMIHWSTGWLPDLANPHHVRVAAAILLHEARHAEGLPHTCPDQRRDRTLAEGGAWAVQVSWLRHMGDETTASSIAAYEIGCQ